MTNRSELKTPYANVMRAHGYKPLPRWWVTERQLDIIANIVRQNKAEYAKFKRMAYGDRHKPDDYEVPEDEIEKLWRERGR